jgi:phosphate transport system substrate-binding protein
MMLAGTLALAGCGGTGAATAGQLRGSIEIDGSSTVFPVTEAVAEEFMAETGGGVRVTVAMSGTGGGFRRFCNGETDLSNASRHIKDSEREQCARNGVEYIELPVALDGIAVVVNPGNTFVQCLTLDELRRIWGPGSTVQRWSDIRPEWPAQPLRLYGPGTNSGTFDYFTEDVVGQAGASRSDYTASEDDNVLVQGVAGDAGALGYFGFAYYGENQGRVRVVAVDAGRGCVEPGPRTIESGEYAPLSRPLYLYAKRSSLERPEVREFVDFYLSSASELAPQVGYIALGAQQARGARETFGQAANATTQ